MKRIKKIGLQASYANLPLVNKTVRRLFALPFIVPREVEETFELIINDVADSTHENVRWKLDELFDYFRRTWIGKYPPEEWNQSLDVSSMSKTGLRPSTRHLQGGLCGGIQTSASSLRL